MSGRVAGRLKSSDASRNSGVIIDWVQMPAVLCCKKAATDVRPHFAGAGHEPFPIRSAEPNRGTRECQMRVRIKEPSDVIHVHMRADDIGDFAATNPQSPQPGRKLTSHQIHPVRHLVQVRAEAGIYQYHSAVAAHYEAADGQPGRTVTTEHVRPNICARTFAEVLRTRYEGAIRNRV